MSAPWVTVKPCSWDGPGQERTEVSVTDSPEFWEKIWQKRHTKPQPVLLERKALNMSLTLFSFIQEKDATEASVAEKLELAFVSVNPTRRHKGTRKPSFVSSALQQADLCSPFEKKNQLSEHCAPLVQQKLTGHSLTFLNLTFAFASQRTMQGKGLEVERGGNRSRNRSF